MAAIAFGRKIMLKPDSQPLVLRPARRSDCRQIWCWRNEPEVRRASFHTEVIPYDKHEIWYERKMIDSSACLLMAEEREGAEVGYVRFDKDQGEVEISICLDPGFRGKGYGSALIRKASEQYMASEGAKRIIAWVRSDNPASLKAFKRAGYVIVEETRFHGLDAHKLVYPC